MLLTISARVTRVDMLLEPRGVYIIGRYKRSFHCTCELDNYTSSL